MPFKKDGSSSGKKPPEPLSEKMRQWAARRESTGVRWSDIDTLTLFAALSTALAESCAVMFAPAAGGKGIMVKLYQDGNSHPEYAVTAEELNLILDQIVDTFQSSSEDAREAIRGGAPWRFPSAP